MIYVVNISGGLTSYEGWRRTIEEKGRENTVAVIANTRKEDDDLWRFVRETSEYLGSAVKVLEDGRGVWEVLRDRRCITIRGMAPCSIELKAEVVDAFVAENFTIPEYTSVFGMEWTETNRMERLRKRLAPTPVWFPLAEPPYVTKAQIIEQLHSVGIEEPRLYKLGFKHNNCGGGCVKAGQAHWAHLLKMLPERYAEWEADEESLRVYLNKDISILKDRRGGTAKPMTLRAFRERLQIGEAHDNDWGECGCYVQLPMIDAALADGRKEGE